MGEESLVLVIFQKNDASLSAFSNLLTLPMLNEISEAR
jgi:hypothetical protein